MNFLKEQEVFCRPTLVLCAALLISLGCSNSVQQTQAQDAGKGEKGHSNGEDWPKFLGPTGYGFSSETGLLKSWPEGGPPLAWQADVGTGYSAPSVLGERVVCHHRIEDQEIVECFDRKTGKSVWKYAYPSQFSDPYGYNNGPRCSPLLTDSRCYTFGAEGRLLCLDLTNGKKIWERKTHEEFDVPEAFFGVGASPVLDGNRLYVLVGAQPNAGVIAFDAENGKVLWKNGGKSTWDGVETGWPGPENYEWTGEEMVVSYSSPIVATIHGEMHLLCLMRHGLASFDPQTGQENFHYWFRSRDHESVNAARPVVVGNRILLAAAYRTGSALLEVSEDGKSVEEVWRNPRLLMAHWSTPLVVDGYIYAFSGRHENGSTLQCVELETGKLMWETNGWEKPTDQLRPVSSSSVRNSATGKIEPWPYYGRGSKIRVDGLFLIVGERGTVALAKATPEKFEEICRFKPEALNYPSWTAPVLSHGHLFLRSEEALMCFDLRKQTR